MTQVRVTEGVRTIHCPSRQPAAPTALAPRCDSLSTELVSERDTRSLNATQVREWDGVGHPLDLATP